MPRRAQPETLQNQFELLISQVTDYAIFMLAPDGTVATWNPGAQKTKGYAASEIIGKSFSVFYPPEDIASGKFKTALKEAFENGRYEEEGWRIRKDGSRFWASVTLTRINRSDGTLLGYGKITKDLSNVMTLQTELLQMQRRYEVVSRGTQDGIFELDLRTGELYFSSSMKSLLGMSEDQKPDFKAWLKSVHPDDLSFVTEQRRSYLAREIPKYDLEFRYLVQNGKEVRWLNTRGQAVWDEQGNPQVLCGTVRDITALKNSETQLLNSARLSSLGQMAGGIAHEINNPLAVIQGNAEQLQHMVDSGKFDPLRFRKLASTIEATVQRIGKIITSLRMFARDGVQDPFEKVNLKELVESTLAFCKARFASHNISLTTKFSNDELSVQGRSVQLSQVLLNLLNNAFDATEEVKEAKVEVAVSLCASGTIEISVSNTGKKIPPEIAKRIMEPFFTTKQVGKGTGLGLSVSTSIVQSHQGELFLDPESQLTRFVVRLPLFQESKKIAA